MFACVGKMHSMTVSSSGDDGGGQSGGVSGGRIVLTENVNLNCCSGVSVPAPVPAPRTSLARRDILSEDNSDPVYVNNDQPTPTSCAQTGAQLHQHQQQQQQQMLGFTTNPPGNVVGGNTLNSQIVRCLCVYIMIYN